MKKVLFVATVVKTHIMHFHVPFLELFKNNGWETAVAAKNDYEISADCAIPFCDTYFDVPFHRSPLSTENVKAYRALKRIISQGNYDIIHCHTPSAAVLTRLAARKAGKRGTKVIYTAHGFHFYKGAPLKNWLLYYPIEWLCAHWTDTLITINQEDYRFAQKHLPAKEIVYVPGVGIDLKKYSPSVSAEKRQELRTSLGLKPGEKMLLSVGELTRRKNHEAMLRALAKATEHSWKYYVCGSGELQEYLSSMLVSLGLTDRVFLLGYRRDIPNLCACADLFLFPSLQEGLPVALMEAIACKVPVLCSDIRGNTDLVGKESLFSLRDANSLPQKLSAALQQADTAEQVEQNYRKLIPFSMKNVIGQMKKIYGLQ